MIALGDGRAGAEAQGENTAIAIMTPQANHVNGYRNRALGSLRTLPDGL